MMRMVVYGVLVCLLVMLNCVTADDEYSDATLIRHKRGAGTIVNKLRIVTLESLPYVNITKGENGLEYIGFVPDLIDALSLRLNFEYEFYESPDGHYGMVQPGGNWTGLIGELIRNKHEPDGNASTNNDVQRLGADIAAAPLTMTAARQKVIDFIHPFHNLGLTIVAQKSTIDDLNSDSDVFPFHFSITKVMAPPVWGLIVLMAVVVALLLFGLNHFNPYEWGARYNIGQASAEHKESFNLSGSLWFVFTTIQWQGFERAPRSIASKTLTCFWFAFVTLTLVMYIGAFMNYMWWSSMALRHNPTGHPIYDLEDLVSGSGKDFTYGTLGNGSTYRYVTDVMAPQKIEFLKMKNYWETPEGKEQLVPNVKEGMKKVRSGKYAFIMESMAAKWEMNQLPCDITTIGAEFAMRSYGLAVPKNWPYLDIFHGAILEMTHDGFIDKLEQKWWEGRGECWNVHRAEKVMSKAASLYVNSAQPSRVDLHTFWGPLVVMVTGVVLSILIAVAEFVYYRYKGRYQPTNRPQGQTLKLENEDGNI